MNDFMPIWIMVTGLYIQMCIVVYRIGKIRDILERKEGDDKDGKITSV